MQSQSVGDALIELAMQLGVEVILFEDDEGEIPARALKGEFSVGEALETLLAGTGLQYRYIDGATVLVGTPGRLADAIQSRGAKALHTTPIRYMEQGAPKPASAGTESASVDAATTSASSNAAAPDVSEGAEVIVTGSRIARTGFDTPTPVSVLDRSRIEQAAVSDISELLMQTPAIAVGTGAVSANFSQDAGASFINLRGLGTDRTLVLVNGRRRVSGGQSLSAVDLATIPASLIERVETITGGASAVYGADAVTGVVNVILREDFEGLQFSARTNVTEDGGADNFSIGMHAGTRFADGRGNVNFGLSYDDSNYLRPHQRDYTDGELRMIANPENTGPDDGIPNSIHVDNHRLPGLVRSGAIYRADSFAPVGGTIYTYDNGLRQTENEIYYQGRGGFNAIGGADGFSVSEMNQLRPEQKVLAAITRANFDFTDDLSLYAQAEFANTRTLDHTQPFFDPPFNIIISRDNALVPDEVRQLLDDNGLTEFALSRFHHDQGTQEERIERNTFSIDTGIINRFSNDWTSEVYVQYGRYQAHKSKYTRIEERFYNAIDAIELDGEIVCASAEARAQGCVPLDMFGPNAASQEAIDYMKHHRLQEFINTLTGAGAHVKGDLFSLPAGPVRFALGAEYREETASFRNDGLAITNQLFRFDNGQVNRDAKFDVKEGFLEVVVPLASERPFLHALNVEGAIRYSDYSHVESATAWKLAGDWAPIPDMRLRVTRSQSVRAPNLSETFNPGSIQNIPNLDPCDDDQIDESATRRANCEALGVPANFSDDAAQGDFGLVGGNPDLEPETANSWTIGTVFTPTALPRFRASIDYWDISIDDAINTPSAQTIVDRCVDLESIDNVFCSLIQRRPSFEIEYIRVTDANIGELSARGIDVQVQYAADAPWVPGTITAAFSGTYLLEHEELFEATDPTTLIIRTGETSNPRFRGNLLLGWRHGPATVDLMTRVVGSGTIDKQAQPEASDRPEVDEKIYNDLIFGYEINDKMNLTVGVNNLFYVIPPRTNATYTGNFATGGLYDVIGRTFFAGVKARF